MKRAGEAALRFLRTRWPMAHRIVLVCAAQQCRCRLRAGALAHAPD